MPKRVGLPGRSELFRDTNQKPSDRRSSGRVSHEEKITVYLSTEELMALEQARVQLRGEYGIKVDRGRMVRPTWRPTAPILSWSLGCGKRERYQHVSDLP